MDVLYLFALPCLSQSSQFYVIFSLRVVPGPLLHPRFWAEFCSRFWDLLCQPTISEEVVRSGLQVLRSMGFSHTSRSCLKFTGSDVMILCDKLLLSLERSNLDALDLSPFQQDYLTLFGLAYVSHLENTIDRSEVTRLPMDHPVLHALFIASLEINGSPDNDGWRGRLRLLYLLQMPDIAYSFVLPVARRFLAFLERIMTSDDGQNPDTLLSQLYPHVICLLLTRDHDVWYEELRDSNHLNRFRSLLAGQPSDIPLDRQALLARQTFPGALAPLYCFMTIWRQCKSQDVLTAKYHYLTSDWAARVDQALGSFVNPNSWTSFSWDISSRAVSEMIASIHEFVGLVVENGLLSGQASGNMIHKAMMFQQNLQRNFRRRPS